MSKGQLERIAATTSQSALNEVEAIQKVLKIQQQENYKYKDHTKMLDAEIDSLKEIMARKQADINARDETIRKRDDTIFQLRETLDRTRKENEKLKSQAEQSMFLSEKLRKEQSKLDDLTRENAKLKDENVYLSESLGIKTDTAVEIDARFQATLSEIKAQYLNEKEARKKSDTAVQVCQTKIFELSQKLKYVDDLRHEELSRSRQTEYKTMMKSESLIAELQEARDEKEKLSDVLELSNFRGDMLQTRLTSVLHETDDTKAAAVQALGKLEDVTALSRLRERALLRENDKLASKLSETTKSLQVITDKFKKIRQSSSKGNVSASTRKLSRMAANTPQPFSPRITASGYNLQLDEIDDTGTQKLVQDLADNNRISTSFDIVGGQQVGKQRILGRYMSLLGECLSNISEVPFDIQLLLSALDFSDSSLDDEEFSEIFKWIRLIRLDCLAAIDFSKNLITDASLHTLFVWITSLPLHDLIRSDALCLEFKQCKVTATAIEKFVQMFHEVKIPGIKLVASDEEDSRFIVSIYGYSNPTQRDVVVVIKLLFPVSTKVTTKKSPKKHFDVSSLCFAFQRGQCRRGSACQFPHDFKLSKVSIRNVVEVPVLDRFFVTSASGVRVSSPSLTFPGLTPDDRKEYEKVVYPRNSIMLAK